MPDDDGNDTTPATTSLTELGLLSQIVRRVERLTPAGRNWLKAWIDEHE